MNEEIMQVLEMVKEGKITTEEGEKLIDAITGGVENKPVNKTTGMYSMLRVRVDAKEMDKMEEAKVSVNIPLSIAKKAMSLVKLMPNSARKELKDEGIDLDEINLPELIEMFENGEITEDLVNVKSDNAEVRVYVD